MCSVTESCCYPFGLCSVVNSVFFSRYLLFTSHIKPMHVWLLSITCTRWRLSARLCYLQPKISMGHGCATILHMYILWYFRHAGNTHKGHKTRQLAQGDRPQVPGSRAPSLRPCWACHVSAGVNTGAPELALMSRQRAKQQQQRQRQRQLERPLSNGNGAENASIKLTI